MVTDRDLSRILRKLGACDEAREWADGKDLATAWGTCNRPDWMLWLLDALGYRDDRTLRLFACWCVKQEPCWSLLSDERSRTAVEVAERYARGEATDEELAAACEAAWAAEDAAEAAAWAAASAAARATARAARAAARDAAWAAAKAAEATARAARAAAREAAWAAAKAAEAAARDAWDATKAAEAAARDAWDAARDAAWYAWDATRDATWAAQADRLREVVPLAVVRWLVDCYANRAEEATRGTPTTYVLREGPEVLP